VGSPSGKLAFAVDCTNTKKHGSITITKKFTGSDNPSADAGFTFRLWKNGSQVGDAKTLTWSASGANTVSFTGLDFGATYYVTEDAADGYIIDSNFAYTGDNSGYAATIGSPDGKLAFAADCTNTRQHGSITVTKKFTNNDNPAVDTAFTFRLWKDGKQVGDAKVLTWSASGDNKVSFSNLDYGATYYVTEDATDGYTTDSQYTGKGYAVKIGDADGTLAFSIDCTNTKQYGSIALHKAFQGVNTNTDPSNTFDVSIDGVDGTSYHATLHLSADGTVQTLTNLPYNGKFKITEAARSGYELVSISETATNVNLQSDGTFGINSSFKSIDVVVTNKQLGAVNIKKLVNYTGKMPDFQIRLTGVSDGKTVFNQVISVPANSAAGVDVTNLPYGQYTITEDLTTTPNYENVYITPKDGFTIDNTVKTATIEVRNRAIGSLKVLKLDSRSTDDKQIPVAGVQFEVYYYNEDLQKVFVSLNGNDKTDANGELLVTGLEVGITYYAHEIKSVDGYDLVDATRAFVLTTPGQVATADPFINNALGKVAVLKVDSAAETTKLAGAVYGIYTTSKITADTTPIARLTTSADAEVLSDSIPFGGSNPTTYYVKEISAPLGYYTNDEVKTVNFTTPGQVIHLSFKDDPIGTLVIKKVDATTTTTTLAGAEFTLYYDEAMTQPAGDAVTTNADGIATFTNLKPATTYWLMETKAPTDYIQWTAPVNVTELGFITFGVELPVVHTFTNKHNPPEDLTSGVLVIKKVDALDETKLLAGAQFRLYYDEALTKPVGDAVTTGTDGIARFEQLEPDTTYWLMETKAPTDYIQWTAPVNVTELGFITFDDATPVVHTFTNQYNPPEPIHTGMMDYNVIIIAGLALLAGLLIVAFTRKRRHTPKHVR